MDRHYGFKVGDRVIFGDARGTVVELDPTDNNSVAVLFDGRKKPHKAIAEWLDKITTDSFDLIGDLIDLAKSGTDHTWKERHAKGVPAMCRTQAEREKWYDLGDDDFFHTATIGGTPVIWVREEHDYPGPVGPCVKFVNFRYKQSWLEKKGGERE